MNHSPTKLLYKPFYLFMGLVLCNLFLGVAQKEPQYTQYMYNIGSFNPAYSASVEKPEIALLYRAQWAGIEGAPRTIRAGINLPFANANQGLGFNIVNDQIGPATQTYFNLAYSYQVALSESIKLSFGMNVGGTLLNVDFSKGTFENPGEPILAGQTLSEFYPSLGGGLFLYDYDSWYLGISTPNFLGDGIYNDNVAQIVEDKWQFNFIGGYVFELSENLKFKPAFLINYLKGAPLNTNVSANFLINEKFTAGASYRLNNAISGLAGFQISSSTFIGYSYDYNTNPLGQYSSGSHELILKFYLGKGNAGEKGTKQNAKGKPKQIDTPRFF
ncbi:MAG: type IX secretion system membrane protein PorP/SprF [Maribacter sp.]|nr:type IX secretion system membrane protein PorP/SprF [Maribacter sp.]